MSLASAYVAPAALAAFSAASASALRSALGIGVPLVGLLVLVVFVLAERRAPEPVLPLWVFARRLLTWGNVLMLGVGALLVGYFEGDNFVFAGKVGTGFDAKMWLALRERLDALEIPKPPFTKGRGLPRRAHWVEPKVVVKVGFIEWTVHRKLRHPRLLGLADARGG